MSEELEFEDSGLGRAGWEDVPIGAFTKDGPWVIDADEMEWRTAIDVLRVQTQKQVSELIRRRRLPPARAVSVAVTLLRATLPWAIRNRGRTTHPAAQEDLAARLRPAFERLGVTFVKFGQLIAAAEGMLPDEFVNEFKLCRDQVSAESFEHVRAVVEQELGQRIRDVFADFDETPFAAASIAQVHRARLRSGEDVVVKVQRPRIREHVARDLGSLAWLAPILEARSPKAKMANLPAYLELFAQTIVEELDFRLEAENMLDVARVLGSTQEGSVVVPRPHPRYVTRRVLVMERMNGFGLDDDLGILKAGIDPSAVLQTLMVALFEGAMIHGVFHGDMHPGNLMIMQDGTTCLLDFGITGRLTEAERVALMGFSMSMAAMDVPAALPHFQGLGGFDADVDLEQISAKLRAEVVTQGRPSEQSPLQMAELMRDSITSLVAQGARLPKHLFLYMKGWVYVNGAIAALAPGIDVFAEMSKVMDYFAATHKAQFKSDIGLDLDETPFTTDTLNAVLKAQAGVDAETVSYRDFQAAQRTKVMANRNPHQGKSVGDVATRRVER